jgi:hypothetical protein
MEAMRVGVIVAQASSEAARRDGRRCRIVDPHRALAGDTFEPDVSRHV